MRQLSCLSGVEVANVEVLEAGGVRSPMNATVRPSEDTAGDQAFPIRTGAASNINRRGTAPPRVAAGARARRKIPSVTAAAAASAHPAIVVIRDGRFGRTGCWSPFTSSMPFRAITRSCARCQRSSGSFARHVRPADRARHAGSKRPTDSAGRARESRRSGSLRPPSNAFAAEHLVEHGAEREDVRARVGARPQLLRRHVLQRADDRPRRGQRCSASARRHSAAAAPAQPSRGRSPAASRRSCVEHDVGGLQIAMDDALRVRGGERVGDLDAVRAAPGRAAAARARAARAASRPRAAP